MHFGLGRWIRNEYVHNGKMGLVFIADNVSSEITQAIAKKVLPEYADFPLTVSLFSGLYGATQSEELLDFLIFLPIKKMPGDSSWRLGRS